jgi:hypothetical protein
VEVISSAQFLKGASAIDNLEIWGDSYLANSGCEFRSSDKFVARLMKARAKNAAAMAEASKSFGRKLFDDAMTVLG